MVEHPHAILDEPEQPLFIHFGPPDGLNKEIVADAGTAQDVDLENGFYKAAPHSPCDDAGKGCRAKPSHKGEDTGEEDDAESDASPETAADSAITEPTDGLTPVVPLNIPRRISEESSRKTHQEQPRMSRRVSVENGDRRSTLQADLVPDFNSIKRGRKRKFTAVHGLFTIGIVVAAWALVVTFSAPPLGANSGFNGAACVGTPTEGWLCLCPRETICATQWHEVVFLLFARLSAYFDYPLYIMLFLSKCHNIRGMAYRTYLKEFLPLDDLHCLHTLAGSVVCFEVLWHSFWHLLRWSVGGDISFLWKHTTGITGLISLCLTPLIAWPMMFTKARRRIPFGYRKAMHYLSVIWGVSIMFHAPQTRILWIMGFTVGLYVADWLFGFFFSIWYCPTLKMTRLGETAVEVVFEHPRGFINRGGGYVYICLPWISKHEWHAFSLYAHPTLPNHSSVCVAKQGDWTGALHQALSRASSRPGYVYGPLPSPYSGAVEHDNLLAVASGIGVTPTLGVIAQLSRSRKVNMLWMCRQADLVEYFVRTVKFCEDAWTIIYYTGKRKLVLNEEQFKRNTRLLIIEGRPSLRGDILDMMRSIDANTNLKSQTLTRAAEMYNAIFRCSMEAKFKALMERMLVTYSIEELYDMAQTLTIESIAEDADQNFLSDSEEPPKGVNIRGFTALIREQSNDSNLLDEEQVAGIFARLDSSGEGWLDAKDFKKALITLSDQDEKSQARVSSLGALRRATSSLAMTRNTSTGSARLRPSGTASGKLDFSTWQLLYCGGSISVVEKLEEIRKDFGIDLRIESFDW